MKLSDYVPMTSNFINSTVESAGIQNITLNKMC